MNSIHRDIFKAIHEGKWLKIEYLNKEGKRTNYWIGIRDLDPRNKTLKVDGLHLNRCSIEGYDKDVYKRQGKLQPDGSTDERSFL